MSTQLVRDLRTVVLGIQAVDVQSVTIETKVQSRVGILCQVTQRLQLGHSQQRRVLFQYIRCLDSLGVDIGFRLSLQSRCLGLSLRTPDPGGS